MSGADKARNKLQQVRGRAKAAMGRADEQTSHLKDAGEKVKDPFRPRRRGQM